MGLILAAVTAAQPLGDPGSWVTPKDYPASAHEEGRGGEVGFSLTVSDNGKPLRCQITDSSGHTDLDALTCHLVMRRARFVPARNSAGDNAFAVYRNRVRWWTEGMRMPAKSRTTDVDAIVSSYPKGIPYPAIARIVFQVDPAGTILNCTPRPPPLESDIGTREAAIERHKVNEFGQTACAYAASSLDPQVPVDRKGKAIASIQTAYVRIVLQPSGK
jgi:TonB family protein